MARLPHTEPSWPPGISENRWLGLLLADCANPSGVATKSPVARSAFSFPAEPSGSQSSVPRANIVKPIQHASSAKTQAGYRTHQPSEVTLNPKSFQASRRSCPVSAGRSLTSALLVASDYLDQPALANNPESGYALGTGKTLKPRNRDRQLADSESL